MNSITQTLRYLPHDLKTRFFACKTYLVNKDKTGKSHWTIKDICRKYHISKASLMRWIKKFDGTKESLLDASKKPKSIHPKAHTAIEIHWIECLLKRNPTIGLNELYGKLKQNYAYTRHPSSLFRFLRKKGIFVEKKKRKVYVPKPYQTPQMIGEKMQLDVKYVPKECYSKKDRKKFYQYTIMDEATRERFIYAYETHDSYTTVDFVLKACIYFGYIPKKIQTDNGLEFTNQKTKKDHSLHLFDALCQELSIEHQLIRPRTPRHNGKVERSHQNDQNRFYSSLKFYSLQDLNLQMKAYLKRSNRIPSIAIHWLSPLEKRKQLTSLKHFNHSLFPNFSKNLFNSFLSF